MDLTLKRKIRPKRKSRFFFGDEKSAYPLLLLPFIWWGIFFVVAFVRAIFFSFTNVRVNLNNFNFVGLSQYMFLFQDEVFWLALRNTLIWTLVMTFANNGLGLLIAWLITKMRKGQKLFLALLFWPTLVSAVASSGITEMVFNSDSTGLINSIIVMFGGEPLSWYKDADLALFTLMIMPTLLGFSSQMMIYYVAIMGVPKDYLEAASIDGANSRQIFWAIYFPALRNALGYNLLLSIIGGIKILGPMQLITNGGPKNSTMTVILYMYQNINTNMSYACACGVVVLIIVLALTFVQMQMTKRRD